MANSVGWRTSTRDGEGAPGRSNRTSSGSQSTNGRRARQHASNSSAKAGCVSHRSRAIPRHWEPWPGKTKTASTGSFGASPDTASDAVRPSAIAVSPSISSSVSRAGKTVR